MNIWQSGSCPSRQGQAEWFTGRLRIDAEARAGSASVTFDPGACTAWHTHPLGQTLIVTAGAGLAQSQVGRIRTVRPGDVVWIPPHEKYWHGASATTGMTHIAMHEVLDGKTADWLAHVGSEPYEQQG